MKALAPGLGVDMRRLLLCAAVPFLMAPNNASDGSRQLSLTIYNSDLALVQDIRRMDVAAGRTRIEFKDVSTAIRPETVALGGQGISILEQNFDYDLLTPSKMMEKAVGKQIRVVRTIPGTGKETSETATVLSTNSGVILKIGERIEVLRDDGIPTRVIFDGVPENLRARPTLSVTVDSRNGGARDLALSYLTRQLSWVADYVAQFDEKQGTLALQGWVTIRNTTGTSFENASTRLVAGDVSNRNSFTPFRPATANRRGGTGGTAAADDGDFPVYVLPARITIAANQNKQVSFLDLSGLKARKIYSYETSGYATADRPEHAVVAVNFSNTGRAMPTGTIRVYQKDEQGVAKFTGEQRIDQTPAGSEMSVALGDAFDVTIQPTLVSSEKLSKSRTRYVMRYEMRNAQAVPATVEVKLHGLGGEDDFSDQSIAGKRVNATTQGWSVPVPAQGQTDLTFTVTQNR
jgi:hypothetical protein